MSSGWLSAGLTETTCKRQSLLYLLLISSLLSSVTLMPILQIWFVSIFLSHVHNTHSASVIWLFPPQLLHKQLPFAGCHIALAGYPEAEAQHMREIAADNGETHSLALQPPLPGDHRGSEWGTGRQWVDSSCGG